VSLPPEVKAVADRMADAYREVQENQLSELQRIAADPNQARYRARLTEQSRAVSQALDEVDTQAQRWASTRLPEVYQAGAESAAAATGKPYTWTKIHTEAVAEIAAETYSDLLKATRFVRRDVKRFVRAAVRERTNAAVIGGRTSTQAGRDLAKLLEDRGVKAVRYKNGALHTLRDYTDTSIRTAVALAHNRGVINHSIASGVRYFAISDGLACGWSRHNDGDLAAGSVRTAQEVASYPISHPRCARGISPLPLVTTPEQAKAARQYTPEEQERLAATERERAKVRTVTGRLTSRERDRRAALRRREARMKARQRKVRR
jgi:hypothetical protein